MVLAKTQAWIRMRSTLSRAIQDTSKASKLGCSGLYGSRKQRSGTDMVAMRSASSAEKGTRVESVMRTTWGLFYRTLCRLRDRGRKEEERGV